MLTHPTLDQLHQLGLAGMARAFIELDANPTSAALSHAEWLALLLDREATERYERRLRGRLRFARLRHQAAVEDVDYRAARGLDRTLFQALIAGRWIEQAQNLIIEGPAGVGKSWLACALGHKACRDNRSVLYQRIPRMFGDLALARGDGRYPRLMRALGGVKLLILDDWGLEPLGAEQRHDMLEIVEDRYGRGATLITSQIPVDRWHDLIGEPTLADAILDRIIHNAHRLQLSGDSLRKQSASNHRRLTPCNHLWRDHIRPAGAPPPRPTSIGTAGRLRSEQVADIIRNARPTSSEYAISSKPICSTRLMRLRASSGGQMKLTDGELRQLGGFGTLLEVDRAIGKYGVGAALLSIDLHAVFEVFEAAEAAGRGPALRLLGGVGDPARAAPGADQDRRPALASRPGRQRAAVDRLAVPHLAHDFEVVPEGAETVIVIVAEELEIVAGRAAADAEDQAVVRHRLQRLHPMGELDRVAQRQLQDADPEIDLGGHRGERRQDLERIQRRSAAAQRIADPNAGNPRASTCRPKSVMRSISPLSAAG